MCGCECECKDEKYFVIYKGDDTDFIDGQSLVIELSTSIDLEGAIATFSFLGFTQEIDPIPSDKKLKITIPHTETSKFPVGMAYATVTISNTDAKIRTVTNTIPIKVTQSVEEAYNPDNPNAISVTLSNGEIERFLEKGDERYLKLNSPDNEQTVFGHVKFNDSIEFLDGFDTVSADVHLSLSLSDWNVLHAKSNGMDESIVNLINRMIDTAIGPLNAALEAVA